MNTPPCTVPGCTHHLATPRALETGWCKACRERWRRAGRPEAGPPPPGAQGEAYRAQRTAGTAANAARAHALAAQGLDVRAIAAQMGLAGRSVRRYLAAPPPQEGTTMAVVVTTDDMPRVKHTAAPEPPPDTPDVAYLHGRAATEYEMDVRKRAILEAREREAALLNGVR